MESFSGTLTSCKEALGSVSSLADVGGVLLSLQLYLCRGYCVYLSWRCKQKLGSDSSAIPPVWAVCQSVGGDLQFLLESIPGRKEQRNK